MSHTPVTHVAIVLDRSGSMQTTRQQAVEGFNSHLREFKAQQDQEVRVSLVTFNEGVFEHAWEVPASEIEEANHDDYQTSGGTAMRDAVGYTLKKLLDESSGDQEGDAYLVLVISDGDTNSDKHFTPGSLRELVDMAKAKENFTITYLGCSESYMEEVSRQTGVALSNMAAWDNTTADRATVGMQSATMRCSGYFAARSKGATVVETYMSDEVGTVASFVGQDLKTPAFVAASQPAAGRVGLCAMPRTRAAPRTGVFANAKLVTANA